MSKASEKWRSERLSNEEVLLCRWGEVGTPVLFVPTAAGDAEECERFLMIKTLARQLEGQRIKLYSLDSVAGRAWIQDKRGPANAASVQNQYLSFIHNEVVPAIRKDCRNDTQEIVVAGASIGAYNALAAICRYPDVFSKAICMSGTYDLWKKFGEGQKPADWHWSSPLDFLPKLAEGEHLDRLRSRFVLLTHGKGKWEDPEESWRVAGALGARGIPNRVDEWGTEWNHDWPTWRNMMPKYIDEFLPTAG